MNLESLRAQYDECGFVIVRELFTKQQVAEIADRVDQFCRTKASTLGPMDVFYEKSERKPIKSIFRLEQHDDYFDRLARDFRLWSLVAAMFPRGEPQVDHVAYFGKAAQNESVTPAHQDNGFCFWTPPYCLKASLAIDAATSDNGVMICQRGSHRGGVLAHKPSSIEGFSQVLAEPLDIDAYPEVMICMDPGDVAVHHTNTIHRSGANTSDRPRRMLSVSYTSTVARHDEHKFQDVQAERQRFYGTKL